MSSVPARIMTDKVNLYIFSSPQYLHSVRFSHAVMGTYTLKFDPFIQCPPDVQSVMDVPTSMSHSSSSLMPI